MQATAWEFKHRALIFGLLISLAFVLYSVDQEIAITPVADWLGAFTKVPADVVARCLFILACLLLFAAALLRTWASAYLNASVVYASAVKSEFLVADGPYRHVRNPLYFANVLLAVGLGTMASRLGFVFLVFAFTAFCYRLILSEEAQLKATQGLRYQQFMKTVPRLWPSWRSRVLPAGGLPSWAAGFKAEFWYYGFAVGLAVFAATFNLGYFFAAVGISILLFWISLRGLGTKPPE